MDITANYQFKFENEKISNFIYNSLLPELDIKISDSSTISLSIDEINKNFLLEIKSNSISSLRAATNTWIRLIKLSFEIYNIFESN